MGNSSKQSAYSRTVYGDTTTSNPYAYSKTDNKGTMAGFQDNTALQSVYNFVNNNINSLLNEYLQPNLNSVTNRAKLRAFADSLSSQSKINLENNIINPLSKRNMIRSSQAQDLYRNLEDKNLSSLTSYANELLANSQSDTAKSISNLLSYYMLGANYLSDMQNHSLKASSGNATKYSASSSEGGSSGIANDILPMVLAAVIAGIA